MNVYGDSLNLNSKPGGWAISVTRNSVHTIRPVLRLGGKMKTIGLTQGQFTLVDDEDFEWLNQWKWYAQKSSNTCYAIRGVGVATLMHRIILKAERNQIIDHINGDGLDNQKSNIRLCNHLQNNANRRKIKNCSSIFKGVCWSKSCNKWVASIACNQKKHHLGCFNSEIDAAKSYDDKALQLYGEFARINLKKNF